MRSLRRTRKYKTKLPTASVIEGSRRLERFWNGFSMKGTYVDGPVFGTPNFTETISTSRTMTMKPGTESRMKLPALRRRSSVLSGRLAERMASGIAAPKAMI